MNNRSGKVEYQITILNVGGIVNQYIVYNKKDLDSLVNEVNLDKYYSIQKIEKFKRYEYQYDKEIIQSPLHFDLTDITEIGCVDGVDRSFSFMLKHKSLLNIKRVLNK